MKTTRLCFAVLLLGLINVVFAQQFPATMEEGQYSTFSLGERTYTIEVLLIDGDDRPYVIFKINDQRIDPLARGSAYELLDGVTLEVLEVIRMPGGEAGWIETVTFTFHNYCGDRQCNSNENCNICQADCGCQEDYTCDQSTNRCRQVSCGDNKCDPHEDCVQDSCCSGKVVDLKTDIRHCGACTKQCGYKEVCSQGVCTQEGQQNATVSNISCGDKICQRDEKNCCSDCGCKDGYSCIEDVCIRDSCASADDCSDNDPCTVDTCAGEPKKCAHQEQNGCPIENECVQQQETTSIENVSSFCNVKNEWEKQRTGGTQCDESYECLSGKCQSNACYTEESKGLIQRLLQWLKRLFIS